MNWMAIVIAADILSSSPCEHIQALRLPTRFAETNTFFVTLLLTSCKWTTLLLKQVCLLVVDDVGQDDR